VASGQIQKIELEPHSFLDLGTWKLFADSADQASGRLGGVYMAQADPKQQSIQLHAPTGELKLHRGQSITLTMNDGGFEVPEVDPQKFTAGKFKSYSVEIPLNSGETVRRVETQELNSFRLKSMLSDPRTPAQDMPEYRTEMALRSATAFSPVVFFFIAFPMGLQLGRYSRGKGFVMSLAILFAFYGLLSLGIGLGRKHSDLSNLSPWIADAAVALCGTVLSFRLVSQ
jgi:lipopolysaccharide export LptBFGC system permease protein LptF